jgi:hypothetical protein
MTKGINKNIKRYSVPRLNIQTNTNIKIPIIILMTV